MPQDLAPKSTKLKTGDIHVRTRADLMAILWRDKRDICMLTNIYSAPAKGNFCNDGGKAIKPQIVMDYNHHKAVWIRVTERPQLLHQPAHIGVDKKIVLSTVRSGHSQ
jgi:hypothetical protein